MGVRRDTSKIDKTLDVEPGYRLAGRGRQEAEDERLNLLERIFDPASRRRRDLVQPGWRCLEVGAGRGSMAVWLAERVGESGQVVATDIDVTYLRRLDLPNLEMHQHNILDDSLDALRPGSFDLAVHVSCYSGSRGSRRRPSGAWWSAYDRADGLSTRTATGVQLRQWTLPIRFTPVTTAPGGVVNGGHRADTIPPLDASCQRCSSAAACRTSVTRQMPRSCEG